MSVAPAIRAARSADLAGLAAIERAAGALFPAGRVPDVDDVMPREALESAQAEGLLLVATAAGRVVGFAMARTQADMLHLAVMAVHPDHGRQGLGRALLLAVTALAAQRGLGGITLTTFEDLPWNGPFYRKCGFRVLRESELGPALRDILRHEAQLGMVQRVAMYRPVLP